MSAGKADLLGNLRRLAQRLGPPRGTLVRMKQGVVTSIDVGTETVTLIVQGGEEVVEGWSYLIDGYTPQGGDVVWILDGGPAQKVIIGTTGRP